MKTVFRRIFTLSMLTAALTVGAAAQAEPLPVPAEPQKVEVAIPAVALLSPPNGVEVSYNNVFTWSHTGVPDAYKLKIKIIETGEKLSANVPLGNCDGAGFCTLSADSVGLFEHVEDGDTIEWRVIATYNDEKSKSGRRTLVMNTVSAPKVMTPETDGTLHPGATLKWSDDFANISYTLIVKHAGTDVVAHKSTVLSMSCGPICEVNPFEGAPFPESQAFEWRVKATGYNGDKAKSDKQSFEATSIAVVMN